MPNLAILGAGFMGETHARALAQEPDVNIVGISSRTPAKAAALAEAVGAEPFVDALALARDPRVDAVSIALPTYLHLEYVLAALEAGKHVLVEKPMALTVADCDAMVGAAERAGRILMVAQTLRFWPEYVALVDVVRRGELGRPLTASAMRLLAPPTWSPWFQDPAKSGGEVLDLHIHDLDLLNWLFGTPTRLVSRGQRSPHGTWDAVLTLVDYEEGVVCHAEGNALMPENYPFTSGLRVLCEHGAVEYTLRAGGAQVDSAAGGVNSLMIYREGDAPATLAHAGGDAYARELHAFVEAVRSDTPPEQGTPGQGRLAVETALAARTSLETGAPVVFETSLPT